MADEYPQRQRFFAMRFCRIMTKACLANSIGPSACWLLSVIAHTEDARHYRGPVSYFNDQLRPLVGMGSVDALDRVRGKAIDAGWLHYTPGRKGQAGLYWVKIPDVWADCDDLPTDESGEFYHRKNAEQNSELLRKNAEETESDSSAKMRTQAGGKPKESAEESRRKAEGKCGRKPEESAEENALPHYSEFPDPIPGPDPDPKTPQNSLVQLWYFRNPGGKPIGVIEIAAILDEIRRHGITDEQIEAELNRPDRIRGEWPSQFRDRMIREHQGATGAKTTANDVAARAFANGRAFLNRHKEKNQ